MEVVVVAAAAEEEGSLLSAVMASIVEYFEFLISYCRYYTLDAAHYDFSWMSDYAISIPSHSIAPPPLGLVLSLVILPV